jgi:arylsulfatase A-like enzyme
MVPTVLDPLGVSPPTSLHGVTQSPIEGVSFRHTFDDAEAASRRITQYFEMLGHRSIYHDGWRAVCPWPGTSFTESGRPFGMPIPAETLTELDATSWELYHVAEDFAENYDIKADNRPRLIEMIAQWYVEAGKYHVLPIAGRGPQASPTSGPRSRRT